MGNYLFKVSINKDTVWTNLKPKPFYVIAESKEEASAKVSSNLIEGFSVKSVTQLGTQLSGVMFVGETK